MWHFINTLSTPSRWHRTNTLSTPQNVTLYKHFVHSSLGDTYTLCPPPQGNTVRTLCPPLRMWHFINFVHPSLYDSVWTLCPPLSIWHSMNTVSTPLLLIYALCLIFARLQLAINTRVSTTGHSTRLPSRQGVGDENPKVFGLHH
jgi:hypothetical protein